jgi:hypothetical protein
MRARHIHFLLAATLAAGSCIYADGKKPTLERFYYSGFWTVERFALIDVTLEGTAKKLGLNEDKLTDYLRLRFKNSFAGMEFKEPDSLVKVILNKDTAEKYGSIHVKVWTVGDDYPVAFHLELQAGNLTNEKEYRGAVLGYGSKQNVPDTIRKKIAELVEEAALAFFKARGEL